MTFPTPSTPKIGYELIFRKIIEQTQTKSGHPGPHKVNGTVVFLLKEGHRSKT